MSLFLKLYSLKVELLPAVRCALDIDLGHTALHTFVKFKHSTSAKSGAKSIEFSDYRIPADSEAEKLLDSNTPVGHKRYTKRFEVALSSVLSSDVQLRATLVEAYGFTVHKVKLTPDRRIAYILWDCSDEREAACNRELSKMTARLKSGLASTFRAKYVPFLQFRRDRLLADKARLSDTLEMVQRLQEVEVDMPTDPAVDEMIGNLLQRFTRRRAEPGAGTRQEGGDLDMFEYDAEDFQGPLGSTPPGDTAEWQGHNMEGVLRTPLSEIVDLPEDIEDLDLDLDLGEELTEVADVLESATVTLRDDAGGR